MGIRGTQKSPRIILKKNRVGGGELIFDFKVITKLRSSRYCGPGRRTDIQTSSLGSGVQDKPSRCLAPYIKTNSKCAVDLNVSAKRVERLGENPGIDLHGPGVGDGSFGVPFGVTKIS